jgi:hypothetical protein
MSGPPGAGGGEGVGGFTARESNGGAASAIGSIGQRVHSFLPGAVRAAEHATLKLLPVADDRASTMRTAGGELVDRAFKGIENVLLA